MKISIIDYGTGNLPSVERAFQALGAETMRVTMPGEIAVAEVIVLPGVGHFSAFVAGLRKRNLAFPLRTAFEAGMPILGICLGLQAMFTSSEEAAGEKGLNFFPGKVRALPSNVKSPHIGWNQVERSTESTLLRGIPENAHFYFAHSYAAPAGDGYTAAVCNHGFPFAAVIERRNLKAVQFHPEKSGEAGAMVLRSFLEAVR